MVRLFDTKMANALFSMFIIGPLFGCGKQRAIQEDLFAFDADERLFTARAFMNMRNVSIRMRHLGVEFQ